MKKTITIILSAALLLAMTACGSGKTEEVVSNETPIIQEPQITPEPKPESVPESTPLVEEPNEINVALENVSIETGIEIDGVTLPDNSIVISSTDHGELGFDLPIEITAEQLNDAGLNADVVKLFYVNDEEITEVEDAISINEDGSITITVSHFSYYVLSEEAPVVESKTESTFEVVPLDKTMYATGAANIRTVPDLTDEAKTGTQTVFRNAYQVIGSVTIDGDVWYQLNIDGNTLYVHGSYLSETQPPEPVPEPVAEPTQITVSEVGEIVRFGGYDWRVLEIRDGKALLLSDLVLEMRQVHPNEWEKVFWAGCDMRKYLNGDFFNRFSAADRAAILETTNNTPTHLLIFTENSNRPLAKPRKML